MAALSEYEIRVAEALRELGIAPEYARERRMTLFCEAVDLVVVGHDQRGRELQLTPAAAQAWQRLQSAAAGDGVGLQVVSAFRSLELQKAIIQRKLAAGVPLAQILQVNAAPGYSEHHTGRAVDLITPGCAPLEEVFAQTPAFAWLQAKAGSFGFTLTYPRPNPQGMIYEPWHWTFREEQAQVLQ
jgi:D-alanyl-D-alanine carboxypeptidase